MRNPNSVTIKDVAQEAGVSYSTVSRVINGIDSVKPDKRARVLAAVEKLGYVVNQQARSLAGGSTNVIGLIVRDIGTGYAGPIVRSIDEALFATHYDLMLYTTHERETNEAIYAQRLANGMTEGLLLLLPMNPEAYLESLHQQQFPYVVIDHQGFDDFSPTVISTNWQGAYDGVKYLLELGHRRIGHIMGNPKLSSGKDRLAGYRQALADAGIAYDDDLVQPGMFQRRSGLNAANTLLELPQPPTAIFAANDISAYGAMDAIRLHGLQIPADISLLGFDDDADSALVYPALTTVHQPLAEMGAKATQMLLKYIAEPDAPTEHIELPTKLVKRASCAPPKSGS